MANTNGTKKRTGRSLTAKALAEAVEVLGKVELFSPFSPEELAFLAGQCERLTFTGGQSIFLPNTRADCLYVVLSGAVLIYTAEDNALLAEYVRGDSFGELEMLTATDRTARAQAEGLSTLLAFPARGQGLREALSARPELAARILRYFMLVVARRTRNANSLIKENSPWVRELRRQVYGDKLTGLYNQAYLRECLLKDFDGPYALVMMKPDNFKDINDRFGHEAGDACLVLIARQLERLVSPGATLVRYQGNEMAVVYPGFGREQARAAAAGIQEALGAINLGPALGSPVSTAAPAPEGDPRLRMSFGIACRPEHGDSGGELISASEQLPLLARQRGGGLILFPEDA